MNFALGDKLHLIVTKFNGYPQIQFRNCVTKREKITPTREGINLILPQYAKLKNACKDLLEHSDPNTPMEMELGYNILALNKLCMVSGKTVRKIILFNNRTCGHFEIGLNEFQKWQNQHEKIEEAIAKAKSEIAQIAVKQEHSEPLDFTNPGLWPIENAFTHMCALLARRAVKPCFPCIACHNNMPWEDAANHTCIIDESAELQARAMGEVDKLLKNETVLRKKYENLLHANFKAFENYKNVLFDTFFVAFLKTLAGRHTIYDIVISSVSADCFGLNPQSNLMYEIAFIVLDEYEFHIDSL